MKLSKTKSILSVILVYFLVTIGILAASNVGEHALAENSSLMELGRSYNISSNAYQSGSINIIYPQISGLANQKSQDFINALLKSEALKAMRFYSDFSESFTLEIKNNINLATDRLLSVEYVGYGNVDGAAYPTNIFYTVNIDITQSKQLKLADIVNINAELLKNINNNNYLKQNPDVTFEYLVDEILSDDANSAIRDSDISLDNSIDGVCSYLKSDLLGISFPVRHAFGDHVEFEIKFEQISSLLHSSYKDILYPSAHSEQISVYLNNETLAFDTSPIVENGRVLVPMRAIFEALGAEVAWDGETQTVTAKKDSIEISLQIGSNVLYKNGERIVLDVSAKIVNNRTLVPLRAVSEGLGAGVEWNGAQQSVLIRTN
ncbi:MAG: stalk domain-containing protein [Oscillospiraceae bacterium]|nr:stalk domain-containing protein [Oscillospiraceae bacterium]